VTRWSCLGVGLLLACTAGGSKPSHESKDLAAERGLDARAEDEYEPPDEPILLRGHAPLGVLHEVVLDPLGTAALTLDTTGGVQLWPALAAEAPDNGKTWPMTLPLQEPLWLSFARTRKTWADGSFLLATIDTSNALQVFTILSVEEKPEPVWKLERRFALPPTDPILEAHVLAGGERVVVLAEDHSVRLYDDKGALVSQLTQPGFVPWQLRVGSMDEAGRVGMVAVLTQPLRVQSIVLSDDQLRLEGDARSVVLDRGPNRNDLELSPDGRTVAALRRAYAKGWNWSVELIDLASDERKLIAGKVDVTVRPRMHYVDDARLLMESGGGNGYWVELAKAKPLRKLEDADPESSLAKSMADRMANDHTKVRLAGAVELRDELPDGDRGLRYQSTTAKGLRATIDDGVLIIDPLDQPHHLELGFRSASIGKVAMWDEMLALTDSAPDRDDKLIFFNLNHVGIQTWPEPQVLAIEGTTAALEFVDDETLLAIVRAADQSLSAHVFVQSPTVDNQWARSWGLPLPPVAGEAPTVAIHRSADERTIVTVVIEGGADQRAKVHIDLQKQAPVAREGDPDDRDELELVTMGQTVTRRDTSDGEPSWTVLTRGDVEALELSASRALFVVSYRDTRTLDDGRGSHVWSVRDAETGAQLWTTKTASGERWAWDAGYREDVDLDWAVLTRAGALELFDAQTAERINFVRGLGPVWRSVPDEQAPTRFSSDHVNTQPLTVRPPSG
jgi:hypothetical protein